MSVVSADEFRIVLPTLRLEEQPKSAGATATQNSNTDVKDLTDTLMEDTNGDDASVMTTEFLSQTEIGNDP